MNRFNHNTIIRRHIEEIENTGDISNIQEFNSEDYVEVYEGELYKIGLEGATDHELGVRRVYPDMKLTIENQICEVEWIVTIYSVTGKFMAEWFGMKPTGKPITFTGENVDRIKDGKIIGHGIAANLFDPFMKAEVIIKNE